MSAYASTCIREDSSAQGSVQIVIEGLFARYFHLNRQCSILEDWSNDPDYELDIAKDSLAGLRFEGVGLASPFNRENC